MPKSKHHSETCKASNTWVQTYTNNRENPTAFEFRCKEHKENFWLSLPMNPHIERFLHDINELVEVELRESERGEYLSLINKKTGDYLESSDLEEILYDYVENMKA